MWVVVIILVSVCAGAVLLWRLNARRPSMRRRRRYEIDPAIRIPLLDSDPRPPPRATLHAAVLEGRPPNAESAADIARLRRRPSPRRSTDRRQRAVLTRTPRSCFGDRCFSPGARYINELTRRLPAWIVVCPRVPHRRGGHGDQPGRA